MAKHLVNTYVVPVAPDPAPTLGVPHYPSASVMIEDIADTQAEAAIAAGLGTAGDISLAIETGAGAVIDTELEANGSITGAIEDAVAALQMTNTAALAGGSDAAALTTAFNALLVKLKATGLMAAD